MMSRDLESNAATLVVDGKGILAADETVPILTRRFDALGIRSTEQSRRRQPVSGLLTGRFNGAATVGKYTHEMEAAPLGVDDPPHRDDCRDD
jgi:fructose-bisphosphate aldolase class 1